MSKEISTVGDIEIENINLTTTKVLLLRRFLVKKTINTLLVTCIMIIKLSHYM